MLKSVVLWGFLRYDECSVYKKFMITGGYIFVMVQVRLGKTEIVVDKNGFGALPIQRVSEESAVALLQAAYEGGMTFFDTARFYTDSEVKMGQAFKGMREKIYIATKTAAVTPEAFWKDLETSLNNLQTDYIDIYQFHLRWQRKRLRAGFMKPCNFRFVTFPVSRNWNWCRCVKKQTWALLL